MDRIAKGFSVAALALLVFPAFAEDQDPAPVVTSKNYVDSGLATKASASIVAALNYALTLNDTISKANSAVQPAGLTDYATQAWVQAQGYSTSAGTQADWNAASGSSQILNKPSVGTTSGTIAAGNDSRFWAIPVGAAGGAAPSGWATIYVVP